MPVKRTQIKNRDSANKTKKKSLDWFNLEDQELKTYANFKNKIKSSNYGIFKEPKGRMILIGDIHGDFEALESILVNQAEVLEKKIINGRSWYKWIGGDAWVICLGDLVDRCREGSIFENIKIHNYATGKDQFVPRSVGEDPKSEFKVLDLLNMAMIQAEKSKGKVIKIMGNHDFESVPTGSSNFYIRYTSPYFFYHTLNYLYQKKAISLENYKVAWEAILYDTAKSKQIKSRLRNHYFRIDGLLNCKLRAGNAFLVVQVGNWIMAHGGVLRNMIEYYHEFYYPNSKLKISLKDILVKDERLTKYQKSKDKRNLFDYLKKYDPAIEKFTHELKKFENPWVTTTDGKTWIQTLNEIFYKYVHGLMSSSEISKLQTYMWGSYSGAQSLIYDRSLGDHAQKTQEELNRYHADLYQKITKLQLFHFKKLKEVKIAIAHCPQLNDYGTISKSYLPNNVSGTTHRTIMKDWTETIINNNFSPEKMYYSGISGDLPDYQGIPKLWRLDVAYSRAFDLQSLQDLIQEIEAGQTELLPTVIRMIKARAPQCLEIRPGLEPRVLMAYPLGLERVWMKSYPTALKMIEKKINLIQMYPEDPPHLIKLH